MRECVRCLLVMTLLSATTAGARAPDLENASGGVLVEEAKSLVVDRPSTLKVGIKLLLIRWSAWETGFETGCRQGCAAMAGDRARCIESGHHHAGCHSGWHVAQAALLADGELSLTVRSASSAGALEASDSRLRRAIQARDWPESDAAYAQAVQLLAPNSDPQLMALISLHGALAAVGQFNGNTCRERLASSLQILLPSLLRANLMVIDAKCSGMLGQPETTEETLKAALAIVQSAAPNSLLHARIAAKLAQMESFDDPNSALAHIKVAVADAQSACGRCEGYGEVLNWYGDADRPRPPAAQTRRQPMRSR